MTQVHTKDRPLAIPQIRGAVASPSWKATQKDRLQHAWEIAKANPGISKASLQHLAGVSRSSAYRILKAYRLLAPTRDQEPANEWVRMYRPSTPVTLSDDWAVVWSVLRAEFTQE